MNSADKSSNARVELSTPNKLGISALGLTVRVWQRTMRYTNLEIIESVFNDHLPGSLILFWHNRLFPVIGAYNRIPNPEKKLYALVSPSRDGEQLSQFLETVRVIPIRGSSSRRGGVALRELMKILEDGHHVAITVDGPRGPCYQAAPGASLLVQTTGAPIYFTGIECEDPWVINSWDRLLVPKPFSRMEIKMDRDAPPPGLTGKDGRRAIQEFIQEKLMLLTVDRHHKL